MEIKVSSRHGHVHPSDQAYIEGKLPKLSQHFERLTSVLVTVDLEKDDEFDVEIIANAEHKNDFVAHERQPTVRAAFDLVLDKMERQLRRYKEKITDHHRRGAQQKLGDVGMPAEPDAGTEPAADLPPAKGGSEGVRRGKFDDKQSNPADGPT